MIQIHYFKSKIPWEEGRGGEMVMDNEPKWDHIFNISLSLGSKICKFTRT